MCAQTVSRIALKRFVYFSCNTTAIVWKRMCKGKKTQKELPVIRQLFILIEASCI